jgi:hypothetical protein
MTDPNHGRPHPGEESAEADVLEQSRSVVPGDDAVEELDAQALPVEADPADAADQRRPVPDDDEDRR